MHGVKAFAVGRSTTFMHREESMCSSKVYITQYHRHRMLIHAKFGMQGGGRFHSQGTA